MTAMEHSARVAHARKIVAGTKRTPDTLDTATAYIAMLRRALDLLLEVVDEQADELARRDAEADATGRHYLDRLNERRQP